MKTQVLLIISFTLIFACRQRDTEYSDDELVNPESVMAYEEDDTLVLKKMPVPLKEWLDHYGNSDSAFRLNNFKASGVTLHMDVLQDAIRIPNESAFADLYIFSPDSSKYIDMVSYNYIKSTEDGKKILMSGEPDQQVVLADSKTGNKKQLMYNGPGQTAEFAAWTGNNSFLIGMISAGEGLNGRKAELYFFHLKDSSFTNFLLDHSLPIENLGPFKTSFAEHYFNTRGYEVK